MEHRLFIVAKDIQKLSGKSYSHCTRIIKQIKDSLGKKQTSPVTINEYCNLNNLEESEVKKFLNMQ